MIDKNILIKNLEDFKDAKKYTVKQFAEFLYNNSVTSNFFQNHVVQYNYYLKTSPNTITKFSKETLDYLDVLYEKEEINIVHDIKEKYLNIFWLLDLIRQDIDLQNSQIVEEKFVFDFYLEPPRIELIDYIIKFCIIPYSENEVVNIGLTTTEKMILRYIHKGWSVPNIVEKEGLSQHTIENHKKNICRKIDDLGEEEYQNKKALAKLNILANKMFK